MWNAVLLFSTLWMATALQEPITSTEVAVKGIVTYREKIALGPESVVRVRVEPQFPMLPTPYLAELKVETKGRQVPIPFMIIFERPSHVSGTKYFLTASVFQRGIMTHMMRERQLIDFETPRKEYELSVERILNAEKLEDKKWILEELNGKPVLPKQNESPYLLLGGLEKLCRGFGGVNRFSGSYVLVGQTLKFNEVLSTLIGAKGPRMEQERLFLDALRETDIYRLVGNRLTLLKGRTILATLVHRPG